MKLTRRTMLAASAIGAGAAASCGASTSSNAARFSLAFAPHEGCFKSRGNRLEQIAYAADQGFTAWEDNEAALRSVDDQNAMAKALRQRGMTMGVFVASMPRWGEFRPLLGGNDNGDREAFLADIRKAAEVAKRLDAKWTTVVPGFLDRKLPLEIQAGRVIDTMRRAAEIYQPHGLVMVMEPLNTIVNHPGVFLQTIPQGYAVARGVNSPAVKILADLYHEQIQAGNLIKSMENCWDEIAYLQFGDNPGRKEPGTGEINYRNVVRWLRAKQFAGVVGMEHGNSVEGREGEDKLIAAYREIDAA